MTFIVLDAETYYDKQYSLRKLTPAEYILSPQFELIGCAVLDESYYNGVFLEQDDFQDYLNTLQQRQRKGEKLKVISHNSLFDMCIMSWRYGFVPDLMIDTLGMSRALLQPFIPNLKLETVAEHFKLPPKGKTILKVEGMHGADIKQAGLWREYETYALHDARLCRMIFERLAPEFPPEEFLILDMVLRMAVVPRFRLDTMLLAEDKAELAHQKELLLARTGFSVIELMSNEKFAGALRSLGVDPPVKPSPSDPTKTTYAFAKSDPAMRDLAEDPRPDVQALVAARVGHRSTIAETRAQRLLNISMLPWPGKHHVGVINSWGPIPIKYCGAHTGRLSGDWSLNAQNWPRFSFASAGGKTPGKLRRAHKAPDGYQVVKRDASQIEARIVAWLAGQGDLIQAFKEGRDVYCEFGPAIYDRAITKADVDERFVCKGAVLGLGFGLGPDKFRSNIAVQSYVNLGKTIAISKEFALHTVRAYRSRFSMVPRAWYTLERHLPRICGDKDFCETFGPVELRHQRVILPNGLPLFYHDLGMDNQGDYYYTYGRYKKKLYASKLYENIVQALARILTMGAALRLQLEYPHLPRLAHQVHDDLVYVVPNEQVAEFDQALEFVMQEVPPWAGGLPLASERGIGPNYGDAH